MNRCCLGENNNSRTWRRSTLEVLFLPPSILTAASKLSKNIFKQRETELQSIMSFTQSFIIFLVLCFTLQVESARALEYLLARYSIDLLNLPVIISPNKVRAGGECVRESETGNRGQVPN